MDSPTIPLPQAAQRLKMSPGLTREKLLKGELRGHQAANGRWHVLLEDIERLEREQAASQPPAGSSDLMARLGSDLYGNIRRAHKLGIDIEAATTERVTILSTMRGDAAEADQQGDTEAAAEIRLAADQLEAGSYAFDVDSGRWLFRIATPQGYLVPPPQQPA
jgi:hypothetical protein